jgi:MFS family permease
MAAGAEPPRSLVVGLFVAVSLTAFETLAMGTVLPTIADEFDGDRLYGATFVVYMLANLISLVAAGERADRTGLRRPYVIGAVAFVSGLVVAGLATSMAIVLVGRALQGAGSGTFASLSYVAVRRSFAPDRQRRMYAILSTGWVVPSLIAPFAAGWITDTFGWRWVFLGLTPLGPLVVALTVSPLGRIDAATRFAPPTGRSRVPLAVALAGGVGLLTASSYSARWWLVVPLALIGLSLVVPALRRLLPPGVLRARPGRPAALSSRICAMVAFNGADFFIPLAAERFHGARPTAQGATILGAALSWSAAQWWAANRGAKYGPNRLVPVGFVVLTVSVLLAASVLLESVPLWFTFLGWTVGGFGMGTLFNPTTDTAMRSAAHDTAGLASTQLNIADVFGFAAMAAVGGAMVSFADQTSLALQTALGINFAIAAVAAVCGVAAGRNVRLDPALDDAVSPADVAPA